MFITLEDETGIANLVVWPQVFEKNRRIILSAGMFAVRGRVQREGEVVHLVAQRLTDLSADLASVGDRDAAFPLPHGRGDEFHHGSPRSEEHTSELQSLMRISYAVFCLKKKIIQNYMITFTVMIIPLM